MASSPPPQPASHPSSSPNRVVITGAGLITALRLGWRRNADALRRGDTAFRPVTLFDVSHQRARLAAEVDLPPNLPPNRLSHRTRRRLTRASQLLLHAAAEAWTQAGWEPSEHLPTVLGTTNCGMESGERYCRAALDLPQRPRGQPTRALAYQAQRQAADLLEAFDFAGPVTLIANACASSANAIGHAFHLIRWGHAHRVLTGGYDALGLLVFAGFDSLQALSPTSCRPFDAHRDGLLLGEGAAILALESLEHACRRHAVILGEIAGYGASTDTHHLTQPHPQGDAALAAMQAACNQARVNPADLSYLNAHGTGTPLNDSAEAIAIARWAGPAAARLPVSSTKAALGHLLGAAGAVEAVISLMTLREQWLPPQLHLERLDPACTFDPVRTPRDAPVHRVLSNSFGFGGANASLLFQRWP